MSAILMSALLMIGIGIAVLILGRRLAVLGAAVGALLGVVLLRLFGDAPTLQTTLLVIGGPALLGFFTAAFAKGAINVVILVLGALAGAAIVMAFLDLFRIDLGLGNWLLAVAGGVIGLMMIRRAREGSKDWGMVILASLIGALLILRGIVILLPSLQGSIIATLILVALAGGGIAYQSGLLSRRSAAKGVDAPPAPPPPTS